MGMGFVWVQGIFTELSKVDSSCYIVAIADPSKDDIKPLLTFDNADQIELFESADELLDNVELDGVVVGTRCNLHTEIALKILKRNLPLFLEKPVSTTYDDLFWLKAGYEASKSQVVVSFPLRNTPLV